MDLSEAEFDAALSPDATVATIEDPNHSEVEQISENRDSDTNNALEEAKESEQSPILQEIAKPEARNADGTFKPKGKPRNDPQARIEQALERQRLAEERAASAERRALDLEARQRPEPKAAPATPAAFPAFETWTTQHPEQSYEDYIEARVEHRLEARDKERTEREEQANAQRTATERRAAWQTNLTAAKQRIPDYDTRINHDLALPMPILSRMAQSDLGPDLVLHLSEHPDLAQRLATLPAPDALELFGEIKATVKATLDAASPAAPARRVPVSSAKAPIKPVGSSAQVIGDEPSDDEAVEVFIARENARDRKAGRR